MAALHDRADSAPARPKRSDHVTPGNLVYDFERQCLSVTFGGLRSGRPLLVSVALVMSAPAVPESELEATLRDAVRELLADAGEAL